MINIIQITQDATNGRKTNLESNLLSRLEMCSMNTLWSWFLICVYHTEVSKWVANIAFDIQPALHVPWTGKKKRKQLGTKNTCKRSGCQQWENDELCMIENTALQSWSNLWILESSLLKMFIFLEIYIDS